MAGWKPRRRSKHGAGQGAQYEGHTPPLPDSGEDFTNLRGGLTHKGYFPDKSPLGPNQKLWDVKIDPDQAFGTGQDSMDQRWDMYEARDKQGAMGAGQMGAGGVYVQAPDGSMHWDETKPDPNPDGGSVISSTTGKPIPGANRQSGPTGPGGTGPPGSQARQLHVGELMANPSFISRGGGSIFAAANQPGWQPGMALGNPMDAELAGGTNAAGTQMATGPTSAAAGLPGSATATVAPTSKSTRPRAVAGELDPSAFKTYGVRPDWPGFTGFGNAGAGAEGGMGAGDAPQGQIDPYDLGSLINSAAQIQVSNNQEQDSHQEALLQLAQNWAIHQDTVAYQNAVEAENERHNKATEDITRQQQAIDVQLAQLDSQTKIQVQNSINQTALQQEQMKEANAVQLAQMQEGTQIYMQQGDQAFKDWQTRQQNEMGILSSALNNPWLQQLTGMTPQGKAGAPMNSGNISNLVSQILQPYDTSQFGAQNAPPGTVPPGTQATQGGAQQQTQGTTAATGVNPQGATPDTSIPDWSTWQSLSPFQKAAYRTNIEAMGPGAWNAQQANMQQQFTQQGGSADVTQLAAAAASPVDQVGQQMNAEAFGQTPQQWQQNQQKNWSAAAAPSVRQNVSQSQGGAASSQATPEQQYGI